MLLQLFFVSLFLEMNFRGGAQVGVVYNDFVLNIKFMHFSKSLLQFASQHMAHCDVTDIIVIH